MSDAPATGVEFVEAQAVPTVVVRATDYPLEQMPALFDSTFGALFPALAQRGIAPAGIPFSLHHRIPDATADVEVGIPLAEPLGASITVGDVVLTASELPAAFMIASAGGVTPVIGTLLKERKSEKAYGCVPDARTGVPEKGSAAPWASKVVPCGIEAMRYTI